jgi:hypothetical protein
MRRIELLNLCILKCVPSAVSGLPMPRKDHAVVMAKFGKQQFYLLCLFAKWHSTHPHVALIYCPKRLTAYTG